MKKGQNIPLQQQIAAAKRELAMRRRVYDGQVSRGKMRQGEADHEIAAMAAILDTLEWLELHREAVIKAVKTDYAEAPHG